MKRTLTKLCLDALFIGACLWVFWNMTGCAALSTNRGIQREAYQRRLFDSATVQVDTVIVRELQYRVDTVLTGTTEYVLDTTLIGVHDTFRLVTTLRVPYAVRYVDTLRVTDTLEVAFERLVPVPQAPAKTNWLLWIITVIVAPVLVLYGWLARKK